MEVPSAVLVSAGSTFECRHVAVRSYRVEALNPTIAGLLNGDISHGNLARPLIVMFLLCSTESFCHCSTFMRRDRVIYRAIVFGRYYSAI